MKQENSVAKLGISAVYGGGKSSPTLTRPGRPIIRKGGAVVAFVPKAGCTNAANQIPPSTVP
jgi:hypothetical protein